MSRPPIFALFLALAAASAGLGTARADAARNEAAVNAGELGDATQGIDKGEFKGAHAELEALAPILPSCRARSTWRRAIDPRRSGSFRASAP